MQVKKYFIIVAILVVPLIYVLSRNTTGNPHIGNQVAFKKQLSNYHLFKGEMSALHPEAGVEVLELSSTLFTDYAEKQRLIRLPAGKKMKLKGNGLPDFPEGTLIAKTFYYPSENRKRLQIVETRLLIFAGSTWNVATYQWNDDQTDALLIEEGATVRVDVEDLSGERRQIAYHIPSNKECVSCHHSGNAILPIGPKVRNLNRPVQREGKQFNQLAYLINKGLIESSRLDSFQHMPSYRDNNLPVEQRARAYMDINCAHCHQSGGYAGQTTINLDYNTNLRHSGIELNKNNILIRMNEMGEYHMPKLGTTVVDKEGLALIEAYIKNLKN
ncbi:hypothetical protein PBAL39_22670 [Pedobacter sp. BAL39]|uniref:hypothetical protein n=1 Tax=Pedobacter sp. BAL39 TaxID=391596 RepID=UPI00015598A8|nr:hypothetical protein [Pedobacter sp. BAL39]EDM38925.1 hypothetical protein PBAL39_22670 [Pedobacter sp. BAL39]